MSETVEHPENDAQRNYVGSSHEEPIVHNHHITGQKSEFISLVQEAKEGAELEKQMSLRRALKLYPKAALWSVVLSTALVMEGYDTLLLANFYGLPTFSNKYGTLNPKTGKHTISAPWRSGLSDGAAVGEIIGLFLTGLVSERIGYRKTILGALFMITGFIFITFFAVDIKMLLIGERIPVAAHNQRRSRFRRRQDHRDDGAHQPNRARDFLRYQLL